MPTLLKNLKILTIGSVDNPANKHAQVVLFKRDDSVDLNKAEWTTAYINDLPDSSFAVIESGGEKDEDGKTKPRLLRHLPYKDVDGKVDLPHLRNALARLPQTDLSSELKSKAQKVLAAAAKDVGVGEYGKRGDESNLKDKLWGFVKGLFAKEPDDDSDIQKTMEELSKAGRAISAPRLGMLKQMRELIDQLIVDGEKYLEGESQTAKRRNDQVNWDEIKKSLSEEARKYIEDLEKKVAQVDELNTKVIDLEKKLVDSGKDKEKNKKDDIWKGVNPEVRKRMEDMEKRAKDAEELAKKERDERITREYIAKVTAYQALPVKPEEFGLVLKSLAEKDPENYAKIEAVLKVADEAIVKGGLFAELGRSGNAGSNALQKAEAFVTEMIQKSAGLTKEQAIAKVWIEHPELYVEYEREQREFERRIN